MNKPIKGKVARVLNTREIAINKGSMDGVEVDMYFDVMDPGYSDIKDPDTEQVLGSIERTKVRVKIIAVQEKLSVGTTYRTKEENTGPNIAGLGLGSVGLGSGWITRHETLKTGGQLGNQPKELDEEDSYVKTGDPVVQFIEATDTKSEEPADNTNDMEGQLTEKPTRKRSLAQAKKSIRLGR